MDAKASPESPTSPGEPAEPHTGIPTMGTTPLEARGLIAEPWDEIGYWTTSQPGDW